MISPLILSDSGYIKKVVRCGGILNQSVMFPKDSLIARVRWCSRARLSTGGGAAAYLPFCTAIKARQRLNRIGSSFLYRRCSW